MICQRCHRNGFGGKFGRFMLCSACMAIVSKSKKAAKENWKPAWAAFKTEIGADQGRLEQIWSSLPDSNPPEWFDQVMRVTSYKQLKFLRRRVTSLVGKLDEVKTKNEALVRACNTATQERHRTRKETSKVRAYYRGAMNRRFKTEQELRRLKNSMARVMVKYVELPVEAKTEASVLELVEMDAAAKKFART